MTIKEKTNRGGILMPLMSHRFNFYPVTSVLGEENSSIFASNVNDLKVDLLNKIITLNVRAPVNDGLFNIMDNLLSCNSIIYRLNFIKVGQNSYYSSIIFHDSKVVEHDFNLDYSSDAILMHKLKIKFKRFMVEIPDVSYQKEMDDLLPIKIEDGAFPSVSEISSKLKTL